MWRNGFNFRDISHHIGAGCTEPKQRVLQILSFCEHRATGGKISGPGNVTESRVKWDIVGMWVRGSIYRPGDSGMECD